MNSPTLATDIVIFNIRNAELKVLLIQMNKAPFIGQWAVPGWFVANDELAETSAHRVLYDATSVTDVHLEQLKLFDGLDRDPKARIVSIWYMAIIKKDDLSIKTSDSYADIDWFWVGELPEMAYDHKEIIDYAHAKLQREIKYSTLIFNLLPDSFTLTELQHVFEIVLDQEFDKRNFRKKILKLNILEDTGEKKTIWTPRPATLYRPISNSVDFVEMI